jgi:hypothetical protein
MRIAWDHAQEHLRYASAGLQAEIVRGKAPEAHADLTKITEVEKLMYEGDLLAALDLLAQVARDPLMGQAFWYHMAQAFRHIIRAIERSEQL